MQSTTQKNVAEDLVVLSEGAHMMRAGHSTVTCVIFLRSG